MSPWPSEALITPYRDGPLLVRGDFGCRTRTGTRSTSDAHDRPLPLRQVADPAVLRRHAQADRLPRAGRARTGRESAAGQGAAERGRAQRAGALLPGFRADGEPHRASIEHSSARAPNRMSRASSGSCGEPPGQVVPPRCPRAPRRPPRARRRSRGVGRRAQPAQRRCRSARFGTDEVISNSARCPTIAPRSRRWSPNSDITFTVASVTPGIASRYAP